MYIAVTIYTEYVVPNLVHPGAEFLHCCTAQYMAFFLLSFLLMYFDTVPLAIFTNYSPLFFKLCKHPLDDGIADTHKSPSLIKALICSIRTLTDCYASKALHNSWEGTA